MRKIICLAMTVSLFHTAHSQILRSVVPSSQFSENLNKVVTDFRNNYYQIQGTALTPEGETDVYQSRITLPGSVNTVIYRFHSKIDTTASWQAIMFQGETYDAAVKAYKNTSRLLNKCRLTLSGSNGIGFTGKLNEPEENVTFASSSFRLNTDDKAYEKFYAEIEMINTGFDSWEVHLNLHNKKEDTDKY